MKSKKIMLVAFILLAILTIGAVSASDDTVADDELAVSDDGESVDSPVNDTDLLSDGDDDEDDPIDDDEGDDVDYNVVVSKEFDILDDDAEIINVTCPEGTEGLFYIDGDVDYGAEDVIEFEPMVHYISESDWDTVITWKVSDLSIKTIGNYWFKVHLLANDDEEPDDENIIGEGDGDAIDYTKFRAEISDEIVLTNNNPLVCVYCPEGSSGTVIVNVRKGDDEVVQFIKDVSQNDEGWLYWSLSELEMVSIGEYFITVEANDTVIKQGFRVGVFNPIMILEGVSYIGSNDVDRSLLVEVEMSSDVSEGRIVITLGGVEIFNMTLVEFSDEESTNAPYWFHPRHGPGPGDESIKFYRINNGNTNYDFEEGTYELSVSVFVDGFDEINSAGNVTLVEINSQTDGDYGIIIYDANEYELGDDWAHLAEITAPEGANGIVKITVTDSDWAWERELSRLEDDGVYAIYPCDFDELGEGTYEITIAYWENDELKIQNSANITFYWYNEDEPDIFICYSDWDAGKAEFFPNSNNLIRFTPNGDDISTVRIVVTIDGEVYLNATVDELNLKPIHDGDRIYYDIGPVHFARPVSLGQHYENVVACYISDNFYKDTRDTDDNPGFFDVIGMVEEIEYRDTDSPIIAVLCDRDEGDITIHFWNVDRPDFVYDIQQSDENNFVTFNLDQLGLGIGDYDIEVCYNGDDYIFDGRLSVVDNTQFRVKTECNSVYDDGEVLSVYCPDGSTGTIRLYGDGINDIEHVITQDDWGNYVGFTLSQLGIALPGNHQITVSVDDEPIDGNPFTLDVPSPMEFNENGVAVIPNEGDEPDDVMKVVGLDLPGDAEGNVTITVDGVEVFNKDLSEISWDWDDDYKYYRIFTSNLDEALEGKHTVVVTFGEISETRTISFNKRNIKEAGGVSIEMISSEIEKGDWEWNLYVAIIKTPYENAIIKVLINGEEFDVDMGEIRRDEVWEDENLIGYTYFLNPNRDVSDELARGEHNITVIYLDENGDEVLRNNATFTLFSNPDLFIRWSDDGKVEFSPDSNDLIGIRPYDDDISSVRIVVMIDGVEYLNAMLSELPYEYRVFDEIEYQIGPACFSQPMGFGHYDNIVAYYYSDNYQTDTAGRDWDPNYVDIIGIVNEIEINDTETEVIAIKCYSDHGQIILNITNNDDGQVLGPIYYNIQASDKNKFLYWKLSDLNLGVGNYHIDVKFDDGEGIYNGDLRVVDKSKFYSIAQCDWLFTADDVLWVWCPEDGEGTIYLRCEVLDDVQHLIVDEEKGSYIGFSLSDLGIDSPGWYEFYVSVGDEDIDTAVLDVPHPFHTQNFNVYLPEEGYNNDHSMRIVELELPMDATGNITIEIDGTECFNKNLEDIECNKDRNRAFYRIYTSDLENPIESGIHEVVVTFNGLKSSNFITFRERNTESQNGISIVILDGDYYSGWGDVIAEIIAPEDANGRIEVKVNDVEVVSWDELGWIDWEGYDDGYVVRFVYQDNLNIFEPGIYNITVTYYFDEFNSISNTGTFTLMGEAANQVGMWDYSDHDYFAPTDYWFHINTNGHTGRVVLTVNGEVRLNESVENLTYVDEWNEYVFTPADANVSLGYYEDVVIAFYSDEDYSFRMYRVEKGQFIIWGGIDIHVPDEEFRITEQMAIINAPKMANGTIVFMIGDVEYFRCALSDVSPMSPDESDENYCFYFLTISDFTDAVAAGHYDDLMIYYYGNDGYNTSNLNSWEPRSSVSIWADSSIDMEDIEFVYGTTGNATINVTGATISLENISVDEHPEAYITIADGVITVSNLDAGSYTLRIVTTPNEYYYSTEATFGITVNQAVSDVEISNDAEFYYGTPVELTMTLTGCSVDLSDIYINHAEAVIDLMDDTITITNLDAGNYTLRIVTTTDNNYISVEKSFNITVNKVDSSLSVSDIVFDFGGSGSCDISFDGASEVVASVDGHDEAVVLVENGIITVSNLSVGNYTLSVTTVPDGNHNAVTENVSVTVNKIASNVSVSDIVFDFGGSGSCDISFDGASDVVASVDGHDEAVVLVENGVITVSNLSAGNYTLRVTTVPDDDHSAVTETVSVTVNRIASSITLSDVEFDFNSTGTCDVTLVGANDVSISVDGHDEAIVSFTENKITVSNLSAGNYTLIVSTIPDGNHNAVTETADITVNKVDSSAFLLDIVYTYGETGNSTIVLVGANDVVYSVDGHDEAILSIADGVLTVSGLDAGNYTLRVTTVPDANHNAVTETFRIDVNEAESDVEIANDVVFDYGAPAELTMTLTGASVDLANISINHAGASIALSDNTIAISGLDAGNYTLSITTTPNRNYRSVTKSFNITVNKVDSSVSLSDIVYTYGKTGNSTIVLEGASDVSASVDNHGEAIISVEGGVLTVSGLDADSYTLRVTTVPDANHNAVTETFTITVNEAESEVEIGSGAVFDYGAPAELTMALTGATVDLANISINATRANIALSGNTIAISNLDAGNYTLSITTTPNKNYKSVTKTFKLTVNKIDSTITIADSIIVFDFGDTGSSEVTLDGVLDVIGSINGQDDLIVSLADNKIIVSNLDVGDYTLSVTTVPDGNHNSVTVDVAVTVNKVDSSVTLSDVACEYGDSGKSTITLVGASVDLANISVVEHPEAVIALSGNVITISNLSIGIYTLNVTTTPDGNHNSVWNTSTITVGKTSPGLAISPVSDVEEGNDVTIFITAKDIFSGDVTVQVGDLNGTATLTNGRGNFTIQSVWLSAGNVTVKVISTENVNFTNGSAEATFTVTSKAVPPSPTVPAKIVAKDLKAYYYKVSYSVTVYGTDGKVAKGITVTFKINGKRVGSGKTNSKGIATIKLKQLPKTYKITSIALGKSVTKKLVVKQVLTLKKVKVKRSAKKLVLTATLKEGKKALKGKKITFKFKGKKIKTVKTNKKGVAKVIVKKSILKKLKVGKKVKYQATYIKDTVKKTVKVKK